MKIQSLISFLDNFDDLAIAGNHDNILHLYAPIHQDNVSFEILKFLENQKVIDFIINSDGYVSDVTIKDDEKIPTEIVTAQAFIKHVSKKQEANLNVRTLHNKMPFKLDIAEKHVLKPTPNINTNSATIIKDIGMTIANLLNLNSSESNIIHYPHENKEIVRIPYDEVDHARLYTLNNLGRDYKPYFEIKPLYKIKKRSFFKTEVDLFKQLTLKVHKLHVADYARFLNDTMAKLEMIKTFTDLVNKQIRIFNNNRNISDTHTLRNEFTYTGEFYCFYNDNNDIKPKPFYSETFPDVLKDERIPEFVRAFFKDSVDKKTFRIDRNYTRCISYTICDIRNIEQLYKDWQDYINHHNKIKASFLSSCLQVPTNQINIEDSIYDPNIKFFLHDFNYNTAIFYKMQDLGILTINNIDDKLETINITLKSKRPNVMTAHQLFSESRLFNDIDVALSELFDSKLVGKTLVLSEDFYKKHQDLIEQLASENLLLSREQKGQYLLKIQCYYPLFQKVLKLQSKIAEKYINNIDETNYFALPKALLYFGDENNKSNITKANEFECNQRHNQKQLSQLLKSFLTKYSISGVTNDQKAMIYDYMNDLSNSGAANNISIRNYNRLIYVLVRVLYQNVSTTTNTEFTNDFNQLKNSINSVMISTTRVESEADPLATFLNGLFENKNPLSVPLNSEHIPARLKADPLEKPELLIKLPVKEIIGTVKAKMTTCLRSYVEEIRRKKDLLGINTN